MPKWSLLARILSQTYLFWAVVSLANFNLLGGLALPFLVSFYLRYIPFLALPVVVSALVAGLAIALLNRRAPPLMKSFLPLLFNCLLFVVFIPTANYYKNHLIRQQLVSHSPTCVDYGSFWRSAFDNSRNFFGNAIYEEKGDVYLWSYSERRFFKATSGLAQNFSCN